MDSFDKKMLSMQARAEAKTGNKNSIAIDKGRDLASNTSTKSNALARAYYRLTLIEKRVMESFISQLDPRRGDNIGFDIDRPLKLKAVDYARTFGVAEKSAYKELKRAVGGLVSKVITTPKDGGKYTQFPLMAMAEYRDGDGEIHAHFNVWLIPHLQQLRGQFGSYPVDKTVNFGSSYTWRLFEILISWAEDRKKTDGALAGWLKIEVDELRKQLGVPESYRWDSLEKQVLRVAQKELREGAQIDFRYSRIKTGKKITHLDIEFIEDDQMSLGL